ncbi:dynein light chain 1, cytoplasmic-like [Petaurus breviceps papuanus]|uniref:dynein light chain 1, cytoplasmic-like n=1 Tax=Petaurus breviceps papuanus TaxID=3040969 RepID=UPI0036D99E6D
MRLQFTPTPNPLKGNSEQTLELQNPQKDIENLTPTEDSLEGSQELAIKVPRSQTQPQPPPPPARTRHSRQRPQPEVTWCDRKAVIKNAVMSEEMQQDSVECATKALEKYNIEKDIAAHIKKEFDKKYNPTWHCIVGRNFGSYVMHETKYFIYFYLGHVTILLFKSG